MVCYVGIVVNLDNIWTETSTNGIDSTEYEIFWRQMPSLVKSS